MRLDPLAMATKVVFVVTSIDWLAFEEQAFIKVSLVIKLIIAMVLKATIAIMLLVN